MKIGVKLFPGGIVALLLGVFLASPLLYTSVVMMPVAGSSGPLLGVNVTYTYVEKITGNYVPYGGFLPDSQNPNVSESGIPRINYFIAFNFTRLSEDFDHCDAKFMVYQVKFYSDNGFVGNLGMYEGIIYNNDLVLLPNRENETDDGLTYSRDLLGDIFKNNEFFGDYQPLVASGSYGTWDLEESRGQAMAGVSDKWSSTFGEPKTISMQISLLGWIALNDNSTDATILEEPEIVAVAQLERFGNGFIYNTIIPEDELSELDPLNPLGKLFEQMGNLNEG